MIETQRNYDVALSFAGEDRDCAAALADVLIQRGVNVFYDEYEKATLWGKDLYVYLSDLYQNQAHFCVMFLSKYYSEKLWTNHEREAAQARSFQENGEYILPIRLDDTKIPGILPTVGYLYWKNESLESIADAIVQKVQRFNRREILGSQLPKARLNHPIDWKALQPYHFESFDGVIRDFWQPNKDDIWSSTIEDGTYVLKNSTDSKAVRYKHFNINNKNMSGAGVSIDIETKMDTGEPLGGAGIIYRFNRETKNYYAFILNGGRYTFHKRKDGVYEPLFSGRITPRIENGYNNLAMVGEGDVFGIYVNNLFLRTIQDSTFSTGDIGIIAMGKGSFYFDNLAVFDAQYPE